MENYTLEEAIEYINDKIEEAYELHNITESKDNKPNVLYRMNSYNRIRQNFQMFYKSMTRNEFVKFGCHLKDVVKHIKYDIRHDSYSAPDFQISENIDIYFDYKKMATEQQAEVVWQICVNVAEAINYGSVEYKSVVKTKWVRLETKKHNAKLKDNVVRLVLSVKVD